MNHSALATSFILVASALLSSCDGANQANAGAKPEAISVLGDPLFAMENPDEDLLLNLAKAKAEFDAAPTSEEAAIWYGRRLGYLDRYQQAIDVYSTALERHPDNPKLLRHRGHRYLTTRKFIDAIRDLSRAAELTDALEDEIELDGIPNARNEPRSTLKFNIWYHLGLAYFFNGDFIQAQSAFHESYSISKRNGDLLCAASNWLYITTSRLGLDQDAELLLDDITLELDIVENEDYQHLLLFYRGFFTLEEVMDVSDPLKRATRGFGVAHFLMMHDEQDRASDLLLEVVDAGNWTAFGSIAAEVELSRLE